MNYIRAKFAIDITDVRFRKGVVVSVKSVEQL
jgi:hypothetical protein